MQSSAMNRPVWNDYGSKLTSAGIVDVNAYGSASFSYRASSPSSLLFDGTNSYLEMPAGISLPNTGCTVFVCTRGSYFSPISFATDPALSINYGWANGKMAIYNGGLQSFPPSTFLPALVPMVHGFRCSAALGESRLYMGLNQQGVLNQNLCNFATTGGAVGRTIGLSDPTYRNFSFLGEIFEIVIFSLPVSDADAEKLLKQMHASNKLRADANANQVIFIGDSQTAGGPGVAEMSHNYPAVLCGQYGGSFKPLVVASGGQNIAQQQAMVTDVVLALDTTPFAKNMAIVCCGAEDIAQGRTDVQVVTDLSAMCSGLRSAGFSVIVASIPSRGDFTSGNITTVNSVNASIRSNFSSFADAFVDWAADSRLVDFTDTTYFSDQINTTAAGDGVKAELIKIALDQLLNPLASTAVLSFASFYSPGRTYEGAFGKFVRS